MRELTCTTTGRRPLRGALSLLAIILLAVVVALQWMTTTAFAQESTEETTLTWSVRPTPTEAEPDRPNFSYDLEPGVTVRDSITVRNYGPDPLPLVIYASDALTTPSGALDLLPAGEVSTDVGTWIGLESASILVPAGGAIDVPFTLVVPVNAESGDHTGGIVTSFVAATENQAGQPVVVDRRLGSRVLVRVAGELNPALAVTDLEVTHNPSLNPIQPGSVTVAYTVTNTGNVRLAAEQQVTTRGLFGLFGNQATLDPMPELLPGNSLQFTAEIPNVWPALRTTVSVELSPQSTRDGDSSAVAPEQVVAEETVWAVPWPQLVLLALAALIPLQVIRGRRRRERRFEENQRQMVQTAVMVQEAIQAAMAARERPTTDDPPGLPTTSDGAPDPDRQETQ